MTSPESQGFLIQSAPLRAMLGGISDMTLHRLLKNPAQDFPRPIYIGQKRFWKRDEVLAWVESRRAAA